MSRGIEIQASTPAVVAGVGLLALFFAPAAWAAHDILSSQGGGGMGLPSAGPRSSQAFGPGPGGPPGGGPKGPPGGMTKDGPPPGGLPKGGPPGGGPSGSANPALVEYLQANRGDTRYLVAVSSAMSAAQIILNTDEPVVSFGGYNGIDPVFTADELAERVDDSAVRFFLMPDREAIAEMMAEREANGGPGCGPGGGFDPGGGLPKNGSAEWIEENCEKVPQEDWQPSPEEERGPPMARARALYDCGGP